MHGKLFQAFSRCHAIIGCEVWADIFVHRCETMRCVPTSGCVVHYNEHTGINGKLMANNIVPDDSYHVMLNCDERATAAMLHPVMQAMFLRFKQEQKRQGAEANTLGEEAGHLPLRAEV